MDDTSFAQSPTMLDRAASLHARQADGSFSVIDLDPPQDPESETGGGGLYGTMGDYGRVIRMILNNGELEGARLLLADTVTEMATNQMGNRRVEVLKSNNHELSNDAEFFPGEPKSWGFTLQCDQRSLSLFYEIERAVYDHLD